MNRAQLQAKAMMQKRRTINRPIVPVKNAQIPIVANKTIIQDKMNPIEFNKIVSQVSKSRPQELQKFYEQRTNKPYKTIFPEEYFKPGVKTSEDLIIHKTTPNEKDSKAIRLKILDIKNSRNLQNQELNEKYSESNRKACEIAFNKTVHQRFNEVASENSASESQFRDKYFKYLEKEQQKALANYQAIDQIIADYAQEGQL